MEWRLLGRRQPIHLYRRRLSVLLELVPILGLALPLLVLVIQLLSLLVLSFGTGTSMTTAPYQDGDILPLTRRLSYLGASPLSEIALVLVHLDHVPRFIINANHHLNDASF